MLAMGKSLSDFTRNFVVVGRQPLPDPNFASYVLPGCPIALLWLIRELPETPLGAHFVDSLACAAASFLFSRSVAAFSSLLRSQHCCLFVAIILPFDHFLLRVVRVPYFMYSSLAMR